MADANRVQVSTLEEKTWGTTNAAVGTVVVNQADVAVGDTSVTIDGTDAAALTVGDSFTVAGDTQAYIVTVDTSATNVTFSPAAKVAWADDAAITTNNFVELPITGGSMGEAPDTVRSSQLRSDAQMADMLRTGVDPTATFDYEMQADNLDNLLRASLRLSPANSWSNFAITATTISAAASDKSLNDSGSGFSASIPKGSWIYVSGFTGDTSNNGWKQVSKTTAPTVAKIIVEQTLVNDGVGESVTITSSQIRNGSDLTSFSLQMANLDIASTFRLITGARITDLGLNITSQSIITGNVGFSGKRMTRPTSGSGAGSVTTAADVDVMSEVTAFDGFWIGGSEISAYSMVSASLNIATTARPQTGLGNLQKVGMNLGPLDVTGSVEFYLESANWATLQDYLLGFTSFEFAFALSDGTNRYFFHMPQVKLTSEPGTIGGIDTDMMLSFDFAADPADIGGVTKTIQVSRVS
tara:strand:- start:8636 stop:10039 length:1404 start_codon:yes stop_codon:yes gene_type:complete